MICLSNVHIKSLPSLPQYCRSDGTAHAGFEISCPRQTFHSPSLLRLHVRPDEPCCLIHLSIINSSNDNMQKCFFRTTDGPVQIPHPYQHCRPLRVCRIRAPCINRVQMRRAHPRSWTGPNEQAPSAAASSHVGTQASATPADASLGGDTTRNSEEALPPLPPLPSQAANDPFNAVL